VALAAAGTLKGVRESVLVEAAFGNPVRCRGERDADVLQLVLEAAESCRLQRDISADSNLSFDVNGGEFVVNNFAHDKNRGPCKKAKGRDDGSGARSAVCEPEVNAAAKIHREQDAIQGQSGPMLGRYCTTEEKQKG